ncbi:flagellin [Natronolimnobius baerhuensis]|uniref:Flagellin n=1 Tax=Natronolimnobius baerhuensis TaxID=253108 RepID=A0A202EA20_9EURY|nr:flagellin [Natronolimnobius baerhuensis]OVE84998.1 hypothetical protein B2G88_11625 [Natronolimnobius baerhuensis]
MGFSTSGAAAIMLIAFLVAASVIFPTIFTAGADTGDAFAAQAENTRTLANSDVGITTAEQASHEVTEDGEDETYGTVTVTVENTGTTTLDVRHTDLLLEGTFIAQTDDNVTTTVIVDRDGDNEEPRDDTDIWPPGTALEFDVDEELIDAEFGDDEPLERVKVVTETGLSDATDEIETTDDEGAE